MTNRLNYRRERLCQTKGGFKFRDEHPQAA